MTKLINLLDVEIRNIIEIDGIVLENMSLDSPFYLSGSHLFYKKQIDEMEIEASNTAKYYELSFQGFSQKLSRNELQSLVKQINQVISPVLETTLHNVVAATLNSP